MDKIKITKDLDIKFSDLMLEIDTSHEFTLRDILRAIIYSSEIPIKMMSQILHCNNIKDYWDEAESKSFEDDGLIDYLELHWMGSKDNYNKQ